MIDTSGIIIKVIFIMLTRTFGASDEKVVRPYPVIKKKSVYIISHRLRDISCIWYRIILNRVFILIPRHDRCDGAFEILFAGGIDQIGYCTVKADIAFKEENNIFCQFFKIAQNM